MDDYTLALGEWLNLKRRQAGFRRQKDLAAEIGVRESTVSQWIRGKSVPDEELVPKLAEALKVTHRDLNMRIVRQQPRRGAREPSVAYTTGDPLELVPMRYVQVLGIAPADAVRWTTSFGQAVPVPLSDMEGVAIPAIVIASGDCLLERGVWDGSRVVIDRQRLDPKPHEIVVVRLHDEVTMKEWHPQPDGTVLLKASNNRYPPTVVSPGEEVEIIGVAKLVLSARPL